MQRLLGCLYAVSSTEICEEICFIVTQLARGVGSLSIGVELVSGEVLTS